MTESDLLAATGNAWKVYAANYSQVVFVRASTKERAARIGAKKLGCRAVRIEAWDPRTERWGGGVQVREVGDG